MDRASYNVEVLQRQLAKIDSMAAVRGREHQTSNVWIYHSPKNGMRFAVEGDAVYFACVLYEADKSVLWYSPESAEFIAAYKGDVVTIRYDIKVHYNDGRVEWVKCVGKANSNKGSPGQIPSGALCKPVDSDKEGTFLVIDKEELSKRTIEFDNWLVLCSAMTRAMHYARHIETATLINVLSDNRSLSLKTLLDTGDTDPGMTLASIAYGIQTGVLYCELSKKLLTHASEISLIDRIGILSAENAKRNQSGGNPLGRHASDMAISSTGFDDPNTWPEPDITNFTAMKRTKYLTRRNAILAYLDRATGVHMQSHGGLSVREKRRLVERCKTPSSSGGIIGFYACIPGYRVKGYVRREPVAHAPTPEKGGCSGALEQIFQRHPLVKMHIDDLYLKREIKGYIHETKITKRGIWKAFKQKLRGLGYTDYDWPFNTRHQGYVSLCSYLKRVHQNNYKTAALARYGIDAARRTAIGSGEIPLIAARRPYSIMQLDYQLVDADSIIVISNRFGDEIEVRVARWYYGLMGDEHNGLITGVYIGFETTPTSDCALKIIDSSLRPVQYDEDDPRIAYIVDGKILPNELLPGLTHQCFNVLRVDNAWANAARQTVNEIIDIVGCSINFGPPRSWWSRPVIERIFRDLTNRGLQQLPSSHGTGPKDPMKDKPAEKAKVFRIVISELTGIISAAVRHHNESVSSGREYSSPLQAMKAALTHDKSGFIRQLLPKKAVDNKRLFSYVKECTVYANQKAGVRPCVKWDDCRYTNQTLSMRDDLINSTLILYANPDDIRDVVATVKETGEDIGKMIPEARWRHQPVSVRFRKLINRSGSAKRAASEVDGPLSVWREEKSAELGQRAKASSASKRKLNVRAEEGAMLVDSGNYHVVETREEPDKVIERPTTYSESVFGEVNLFDLPTLIRTK